MTKARKTVLSSDAWAKAALDAIAERGVDGVAIEPLARRLGVTKGSFYWHFAHRNALLEAALKLWEQRETGAVLDRVRHETDPRSRIKRLIGEVSTSKRASRTFMALSGANQPELVRQTVQRVAKRRLDFFTECYEALGLPDQDARQWARMTFSVFVGTLAIRRDLPEQWPAADAPEFGAYLQFLMAHLTPQDGAADRQPSAAPDVQLDSFKISAANNG